MLPQQLKSMHSLHLEDVVESSSATPSNTVPNYNQEQRHSLILHDGHGTCDIDNCSSSFSHQHSTIMYKDGHGTCTKFNKSQRHSPILYTDGYGTCTLFNKSLNWIRSFFDRISQPTRSGFGESSSNTSLKKLWYTYSYIYKFTKTKATIFYKLIIALLFLLLILMPTPSSSLHKLSSIVSPSPNPLSKTRSFTMSDFTPITQLFFIFGPHHSPKYEFLDTALNNVYSEPLDDAVLASLFTDANKTAFKPDAEAGCC